MSSKYLVGDSSRCSSEVQEDSLASDQNAIDCTNMDSNHDISFQCRNKLDDVDKEQDSNLKVSCDAPVRVPKDQVINGKKHDFPLPERPYRDNYPSEYSSWSNMKQRCRLKKGILDPRFVSFGDFYQYLGPKPASDYTLDRIDPCNPEYSPDNCRWASKSLQTANRRSTRILEDRSGRRLPVAEWSRLTGIKRTTILSRIDNGWSDHEAVTIPVGKRRQNLGYRTAPSTEAALAVAVWRRVLRNTHDQSFLSVTAKDAKMLKEIVSRFEREIDRNPLEVLEMALKNWSTVTIFAEEGYGAYKSPRYPTPEYFTRYLNAIGNWVMQHLEREEKEKRMREEGRAEIQPNHPRLTVSLLKSIARSEIENRRLTLEDLESISGDKSNAAAT